MSTVSVNPLEREIEKKVCKYAESKGIWQRKIISPSHNGLPDRIFMLPSGTVFFIEFKRKGEKPTPMQLREHEKIRQNNGLVWVIDNVEDGKKLIDGLLQATDQVLMKRRLEEMTPQKPLIAH